MQSPAGRKLLADNGLDADDPISFLVLVDGQSYNETTAVIHVVSTFGGVWRAVKVLHIVPRFIRDPIYRYIARHRYRLFGKRDSCIVPDEAIRYRFVHDLEELQTRSTSERA